MSGPAQFLDDTEQKPKDVNAVKVTNIAASLASSIMSSSRDLDKLMSSRAISDVKKPVLKEEVPQGMNGLFDMLNEVGANNTIEEVP